jgi:DNA-directed RNA polymerase specialized sigma24 family protein
VGGRNTGGQVMGAAAGVFMQSGCEPHGKRENSALFNARFVRSRSLLHFTARRILGGSAKAELAVWNCWRTASRNPPQFEHDGAFRSWLFRVLINEALAIRRLGQWLQLGHERHHHEAGKELNTR